MSAPGMINLFIFPESKLRPSRPSNKTFQDKPIIEAASDTFDKEMESTKDVQKKT